MWYSTKRPGDTIKIGRDLSVKITGSYHDGRAATIVVSRKVELRTGDVFQLGGGMEFTLSDVLLNTNEVVVGVEAPQSIKITTSKDVEDGERE